MRAGRGSDLFLVLFGIVCWPSSSQSMPVCSLDKATRKFSGASFFFLFFYSLPFFCHAFCFHLTSKLNGELSRAAFNNVWKMS